MNRETREELRVRYKQTILEVAKVSGNTVRTCREFGVATSSFYDWKRRYDEQGKAGLYKIKPIPYSHPKQLKPSVIKLILKLRTEYQLGPERIRLYLDRFHGIQASESTIYRTLKRQ